MERIVMPARRQPCHQRPPSPPFGVDGPRPRPRPGGEGRGGEGRKVHDPHVNNNKAGDAGEAGGTTEARPSIVAARANMPSHDRVRTKNIVEHPCACDSCSH
eukprot:scaffold582_cov385-Prasinococcus_capsulatus_cf.AAC.6